jgi:methylmalonyl-CoA epimerase
LVAVEKISHLGIAVADMDQAIKDFSSILNVRSVERQTLQSEGIEIAFLKLDDGSEIELLCPSAGSTGAVAKFLNERGEGIHHFAVKVPNVQQAIEDAKSSGFILVDKVPRKAARGAEAAFVHPKSLHGVLLEFYSK